jgi:glycosyltransferase involved in cell wall biosynthesis
MGDASVFIADSIDDSVLLILDAYVPIYIEVSARNSEDATTELSNYSADLVRFNHVLRRGDYFLCANSEQFDFYTGVLASLGVINPATYQDDRILIVPFGIHEDEAKAIENNQNNPYKKLGIAEDSQILLWFGGLYPWFNFKPLLSAVEEAAQTNPNLSFVVVGGKNPFNSHPDFVKQYDYVTQAVHKNKTLQPMTHFVDWVDYDDRLFWYEHASLIVSINSDGKENRYAWRTRVMDYLTARTPIITNGGDPLSDLLVAEGAAIKIQEGNLPAQLSALLKSKSPALHKVIENLTRVSPRFYWNDLVRQLSIVITGDARPYSVFKTLSRSIGVSLLADKGLPGESSSILSKGKIQTLHSYYRKARNKGIKRSVKFAAKIGINYARSKLKHDARRGKQVFFFSHPIDDTGAPLVLLDVADDFSHHFKPKDINIIAPGIKSHLETPLRRKGFSLHKMAMGISKRIIHMQLGVQPEDFVLMNTVALYDDYRKYVYWLLQSGKLHNATWFIHEDKPELRFTNQQEINTIKQLLRSGKLHMRVPSLQTAKEYNHFFDSKEIQTIDLRVAVPEKYTKSRLTSDFKQIAFTMSGTPEDGRKGQLLFLAALQYYEKHLKKSTVSYRPYSVNLIAIGDDYISQQIKTVGESILGDKFRAYPKMPKDDAMEITHQSNVTVCASLNESFGLFVAEGMTMGHAIIRNHCSGWQEQMINGENGYLFRNDSLKDFAEKIEIILNETKTTNSTLHGFGEKSQEIVLRFQSSDYFKQLVQ